MQHVPYNVNLLVFKTACSERERLKAGRFQRLLDRLLEVKCFVLASTKLTPTTRTFLTPKIVAKVAEEFPQFLGIFDVLDYWSEGPAPSKYHRRNGARYGSRYSLSERKWGGTYSTFSSFVDYVLRLVVEESPDFVGSAASMPRAENLRHANFVNTRFLTSTCCSPWSIPSEQEIDEMEKVIPLASKRGHREDVFAFEVHRDTWMRIKWRWSAVACAISVLESLPHHTRLQIRQVRLEEDHESVGHPECHAAGLIPFCLENPKLHFERRVNIWRNLLPAGMKVSETWESSWGYLSPAEVSRCFEPWMSEAYVLDGMPAGSYSLLFDGDPIPDISSEIFEEVKHDVTYQLAVDRYLRQKHGQIPVDEWRQYGCYLSEPMPRALEDLLRGESFMHCNFDVGNAWDEEEMLHRFDHWNDLWSISSGRCRFTPRRQPRHCYDTVPPLPSWYDIRFSQILPALPDKRRLRRRPEPLGLQVGYRRRGETAVEGEDTDI